MDLTENNLTLPGRTKEKKKAWLLCGYVLICSEVSPLSFYFISFLQLFELDQESIMIKM